MEDAERAALLEDRAVRRVGAGLSAAGVVASRRSPACGDEITVGIDRDGTITWDGHGCVVSTAAASALGELSADELRRIAPAYLASVEPGGAPVDGLEEFAGIGRFPLRAGCATLAWRTALDALAAGA